jgi:hypothetical protein
MPLLQIFVFISAKKALDNDAKPGSLYAVSSPGVYFKTDFAVLLCVCVDN